MTSRTRIAFASSVFLHAAAAALLFAAFWEPFWRARPRVEVVTAIDVVETSPAPAAVPRQARKLRKAGVRDEHQPASPPAAPAEIAGAPPGAGNASAIGAYLARVRGKLSHEILVPRSAAAPILQATLEMTLTSNGQIESSRISQSSGSDSFDSSVTEALRRAAPFPPFSEAMGGIHEMTVKIPIEIRNRY